nr:RNA-directed DNA polymerase, eukaryota [Tanacetum cinerariifolium]
KSKELVDEWVGLNNMNNDHRRASSLTVHENGEVNEGPGVDSLVQNEAEFVKSPQLVRMEGSSGSVGQSVEYKGGSILGVLEEPAYKRVLWEYLSILLGRWNGDVIIMGDFNEVRRKEERRGSLFNQSGARFFNQFITNSGLIDVKMEGFSFTWSHPSAMKMSKLDRFLVSDGIILSFPSITALCLDRHLSDHRPILLREILLDFGPTPFRFYHSWFSYDGFDEMVEKTWRSFSYSDTNRMIRFKKKLQDLKSSIRLWVKDKRANLSRLKYDIVSELCKIDKELESGLVSDDQLARRLDLKGQLHDINDKEVSDRSQKSKVRWAIEGDENSSFFRGIINKKRSQLEIRGILVDGSWQSNPQVVKEVAIHLLLLLFPRLSQEQVLDLEREVSRDEIRLAVWSCGDNKSPGCNSSFITLIPKVMDAKLVFDFRPISLIGCVYKVVTKILAKRLSMVISNIVSNTQSAFVSERQILDGPFIMNELLHWCKRKNKRAMFFKDDFVKAYDSVHWDYLIDVLEAFGFGLTWCQWIRGLCSFAKASVLVNGSPSSEFQFQCGLKQGDPLAPLLFILAMESLHLSFSRVVEAGIFKAKPEIELAASSIGCSIMKNQFRYLGVTWKTKTLSIGGRLTLLKSVLGASPLYCMSIFKTPKGVLKEMESIRNKFFIRADNLEKKLLGLLGIRGDSTLHDSFPRMFALEMEKICMVATKMAVAVDASFRRSVRGGFVQTKWMKYVPIKINIFVWRARRDCLPTRENLMPRGVIMESTDCPICGLVEEEVHHILLKCDLAHSVLRRICRWWDIDWQSWSSFHTWYGWFSSIKIAPNNKKILKGVFYVAWWSIWVFRNRLLFDDKIPVRSMIFDDIVSLSYLWCKNRCKWAITWEAWLKNPHLISL